jgi:thioesterase domain-containing protein/acyl carrier protein
MSAQNFDDIYELSPIQQYMLFNTLSKSTSGLYVEQSVDVIEGRLDVSAFERSWHRVADRYGVLRTAFFWEDLDKPLQVVFRDVKLPLEKHDWREVSPDERQARLETYLQNDRNRGFTISEPPLARLALIQLAENTYYFVRTFHHLLMDRWSVSLILKEVFVFYEAFCDGRDLHFPQVRPYRDYILWLQQQDFAQAEAFWRLALKNFTAPTVLAADHVQTGPRVHGEAYDAQRARLSVTTTAALRSCVQHNHLTLNTLVQGAWALILSRYSGKQDVVFGAVVSGRPAALSGVESMIGLFMNTLPVRVQVSLDEAFLPWLQRLQGNLAELAQYEYSPLADVLGWSEVSGGQLLFESILVFQNTPANGPSLRPAGALKIRRVHSRGGRTNYPLTMMIVPGPELSLRITYDCNRFNAAAISQLMRHLQVLLEKISVNPEQSLSDLVRLIDISSTLGDVNTPESREIAKLARNGFQKQKRVLMAPRDELELQLTKVWEKVLGHRPVSVTDNFFDLGGQSLLAVRLFAQIEKIVGKKLPIATLFQAPTIEQLADIIRQQEWSVSWKSLVAIQPGGWRPPFFCVHAHDGGVLFWRDLARHMRSDQPFYAFQARGLDGSEPPLNRIEELAAHYIKEMRTLQPDGPYFIGGHCLGGLIAFEMAQQLHADDERVALLALFDCYAPRRPKSAGSFRVNLYAYKILRILELIKVYVGNFMLLERRERLPYMRATSNRALYKLYMWCFPWVSAARTRKAILRAGSVAARKYGPKTYLGRVTLFRASQLPAGSSRDSQMGWESLTAGGLEVHIIPGYFGQIIREPRVRLLARQFTACLLKEQQMKGSEPLVREARSDESDDAKVTDSQDRRILSSRLLS